MKDARRTTSQLGARRLGAHWLVPCALLLQIFRSVPLDLGEEGVHTVAHATPYTHHLVSHLVSHLVRDARRRCTRPGIYCAGGHAGDTPGRVLGRSVRGGDTFNTRACTGNAPEF